MRLFHWHSLLQPFWTFCLEAIQPKSKKRNLGNNTVAADGKQDMTEDIKMDRGYESSVWQASLDHLRAGNRSKSGKPRYNAEGVTWPKLSSWHHVFNGGSPLEIRGSEISGSEVEQIQKFGENYANQLKKILGTKTCNSQSEIKLQHAATFKGSFQCHWHVRKDFSCGCCPPFAVSFYSARMGGVYFLLKLRDSKPSEHSGKIKLRNILIYTVLATWLRLACGFCLNQVAFEVGILVEGFCFTYTHELQLTIFFVFWYLGEPRLLRLNMKPVPFREKILSH